MSFLKTYRTRYHRRVISITPMNQPQELIFSNLDLPHYRKDPTMNTELKEQVDLSLDVKQQFLVPINIHFYEDKFWSYIVTKNVGQTKDVVIYDRSISKIFKDAVM